LCQVFLTSTQIYTPLYQVSHHLPAKLSTLFDKPKAPASVAKGINKRSGSCIHTFDTATHPEALQLQEKFFTKGKSVPRIHSIVRRNAELALPNHGVICKNGGDVPVNLIAVLANGDKILANADGVLTNGDGFRPPAVGVCSNGDNRCGNCDSSYLKTAGV